MAQSDGQSRHAAGEAMKPTTLAARVAAMWRDQIHQLVFELGTEAAAPACDEIHTLCASIARETREATVRECITIGEKYTLHDMAIYGTGINLVLARLRVLLTPPDEQREET